MALLLRLQQGPATAPELSEELEVSVRTIYRDVVALQSAGVPLWTETGPAGGIRLVEGWRMRLDGLTGDEAGALFFAGAPAVADDLGLGALLLAAETKVMTTLPPEWRTRADRIRSRFHLDAPGWFHRDESIDQLAHVADAVWAGRRLDVVYRRGSADAARRLDPLGLVLKGGHLVPRGRPPRRVRRPGGSAASWWRPSATRRSTVRRVSTWRSWWAASAAEFDRSILHYRCRLRVSPRGARTAAQGDQPRPG